MSPSYSHFTFVEAGKAVHRKIHGVVKAVRRKVLNAIIDSVIKLVLPVLILTLIAGLTAEVSKNPVGVFRFTTIILALVLIPALYFGLFRKQRMAPRRFSSFEDAESQFTHYLREGFEQLKRGDDLRIQVVAVAMHYSWRAIAAAIRKYWLPALANPNRGCLFLDLVLMSPSGLRRYDFGAYWLARRKATIADLNKLKSDHHSEIRNGKLSITLYSIEDLPPRHGILLNGSILWESFCQIRITESGYDLTVGTNPYELFELGAETYAKEKIDEFNTLFIYYQDQAKRSNSSQFSQSID